jgi:hypothetical protein
MFRDAPAYVWGVAEGVACATSRIRTRRRLGAAAPKAASGGYSDRYSVKGRTGASTIFTLSAALGSPRSSPETEAVEGSAP